MKCLQNPLDYSNLFLFYMRSSIISPRSLTPNVNQIMMMPRMIFTTKGIENPKLFRIMLFTGGKKRKERCRKILPGTGWTHIKFNTPIVKTMIPNIQLIVLVMELLGIIVSDLFFIVIYFKNYNSIFYRLSFCFSFCPVIIRSFFIFLEATVQRLSLFVNTITEIVAGFGFFSILTLLPAIF